jgi:hypothetical protein
MVFPEAVVAEVEAEVDELEVLNTVRLCTRGRVPGVGDRRKAETWRLRLGAAQCSSSSTTTQQQAERLGLSPSPQLHRFC